MVITLSTWNKEKGQKVQLKKGNNPNLNGQRLLPADRDGSNEGVLKMSGGWHKGSVIYSARSIYSPFSMCVRESKSLGWEWGSLGPKKPGKKSRRGGTTTKSRSPSFHAKFFRVSSVISSTTVTGSYSLTISICSAFCLESLLHSHDRMIGKVLSKLGLLWGEMRPETQSHCECSLDSPPQEACCAVSSSSYVLLTHSFILLHSFSYSRHLSSSHPPSNNNKTSYTPLPIISLPISGQEWMLV